MDLNIHPLKELIILLFGPLFQNIAYLLLIIFFNEEIVLKYHIGILLFNLLPIYPLDGGKILDLFFEIFIPYKKALQLSIYLSYILVVIIYIKNISLKLDVLITVIVLSLFIFTILHLTPSTSI